MNILFVHQGFPGQYIHIVRVLAREGKHRIVAMGRATRPAALPQGVTYVRYSLERGNTPGLNPLTREIESKIIRADACATQADKLRQQGFIPDLICAHPGWGESLFLREVWPDCALLSYQEFYYTASGSDVDFDPEFSTEPTWRERARIQAKNASMLLSLQASSWCISPTRFQHSSFPSEFAHKFSIIHDGINCQIAKPKKKQGLWLNNGIYLNESQPVVTYVSRSLEPYRGIHSFIRSIPHIQSQCPDAQIVIVGAREGCSYGQKCPSGEWVDRFLTEIEGQYEPTRIHMVGQVPYADYISILQRSNAHVYLTYPFVLSWSLMEAMSCGTPLIGSATAPVLEVIRDGENGLCVDFFNPRAIAEAVASLLGSPTFAEELGRKARKDILSRYSLERCIPQQRALIELVANRNSLARAD